MRSATKKRIGKNPEYLAFIHDQACCVSGSPHKGRLEAAHIGPRGLSQKVPDRAALPMCGEHHRWLHIVGPKQFWEAHKLNPMVLIQELNERFDRGERAA